VAYTLASNAITAKAISVVLVDDTGTIVDLCGNTFTLDTGVAASVATGAWKSITSPQYFVTTANGSFNFNGVRFTAPIPTVDQTDADGMYVWFACHGADNSQTDGTFVEISAGAGNQQGLRRVSSANAAGMFTAGGGTVATSATNLPTNGTTKFSFGAYYKSASASEVFYGLESGSLASDGTAGSDGGFGGSARLLNSIGGDAGNGNQAFKPYAVCLFDGDLTLVEKQALHDDWLLVLAGVGGAPSGPTVTDQPDNQNTYPGEVATFTVAATTSGGSLSYQWKFNGSNVGTNSVTYTRTTVIGDDLGLVTCDVTDSNGTTTTNAALLRVFEEVQGALFIVGDDIDHSFVGGVAAVGGDEYSTGGTAYEFNAEPAAFTITASAATTAAARNLDAQPAAFSITANAATLSRGITLDAQPAAFTISAIANGITAAYNFRADPLAVVISGIDADLTATVGSGGTAYEFNAEPAAFTITAQFNALPVSRNLDAQPAAFSITAVAATLPKSYIMPADPASYTITALSNTTPVSRNLDAQPAAFSISANAATLSRGLIVVASPASYTIVVNTATTQIARTFNAEPASVSITPYSATLDAGAPPSGTSGWPIWLRRRRR